MPRFLILAALLALPLPVAAQTVAFGGIKADTRAPVEVTAETLKVDQSTGQANFTGNVLIGQGQMRLSADSVTVTYAQGGQQKIKTLNASGGVTLVNGPDAAEAAEAVYDVETGNIVLTGDAIVTQGQNVLAGDRIEVNLTDGTASVAGRVRTVLQPGGN
ncbi:lipopolysaccharide transport periplasmic protein LptA [Paracoccus sphaerophysae]|uniref:Organic solvent tolerance protein OstA n=1 Tax=Paracoccus sphaerophysae TaxID=690417 RepID=A0A099FEE7_9RHOB|nr:lipopolysaccharide transport periplasmic protein LptA [Paracoccus sphaerophysae]KGJ09145.1 organic solvent tolerance protein OstA [Paracoccus sphaerophysae]